MPLCSLHLIAISGSQDLKSFVAELLSSVGLDPVFIARPLRWMIDPWILSGSAIETNHIASLRETPWDVAVIFPSVVDLPSSASHHTTKLFSLNIGISSKILGSLNQLNQKLLDPSAPKPPLTGSLDKNSMANSSKDLELTDDLMAWFSSPEGLKTPPSMLNLLTFNPGTHDSYVSYGREFAKDVGRRRGGLAKIVGPVVSGQDDKRAGIVWDEIAIAHYPSVWHFADMISGEDYQKVNSKYRVGALRGTGILCCNELDEAILGGVRAAKALKAKI